MNRARSRPHARALLAALAVLAAACGGGTGFSEQRARVHVRRLADTIGSRPAGSDANRLAREYIAGELRRLGFDVRVQEAEAERPALGLTAHVFNIIAARRGASPEAVALVTHYDSPPDSVGAADDGLGVAVLLEAARVLAARPGPRWSLVLALTDGEELGLMGAAAIVKDPVMSRVGAYLNLEAVGTTGPSLLFQAGPGNAWLVRAWASGARSPAGNSISTEIYRRLPNDTDFSVIRELGIPGLNFAPVGYSEAYHTPRDTAANLSARTLEGTGDNVVSIVRTLDRVDIRQRAPDDWATYFDLAEAVAVVYGPRATSVVAWLAVGLGALAWLRMLVLGRRAAGLARVLVGFPWALAGVLLAALAMTGATWLMRAVTGWLHPWHGRPLPFLALLLASALLAVWAIARLSALVPAKGRGAAEPVCLWAVALPLWVVLATLVHVSAPAAGFALAWPLLVAGVGLLSVPGRSTRALRLVSIAVLLVGLLVTLSSAVRLLLFAGPAFARMPLVMPVYAHAALLTVFAIPLLPPLVAALPPGARRALRSAHAGAALATGLTVAFLAAWAEAGYSHARPHLRAARYLNVASAAGGAAVEYWEVGGNEPMPHASLLPGHPGAGAWRETNGRPPVDPPLGRLNRAFIARLERRATAAFPGRITAGAEAGGGSTRVFVRVAPDSPTATVVLVLAEGVRPAASNYAGRVADGRWRAAYVAAPPGGVEFRVELRPGQERTLGDARVVLLDRGLPGGVGWQRLPPWLPQERDVWTARSVFVSELRIENGETRSEKRGRSTGEGTRSPVAR